MISDTRSSIQIELTRDLGMYDLSRVDADTVLPQEPSLPYTTDHHIIGTGTACYVHHALPIRPMIDVELLDEVQTLHTVHQQRARAPHPLHRHFIQQPCMAESPAIMKTTSIYPFALVGCQRMFCPYPMMATLDSRPGSPYPTTLHRIQFPCRGCPLSWSPCSTLRFEGAEVADYSRAFHLLS
jgi:hypothetical protein